jgi:hypothetical protein
MEKKACPECGELIIGRTDKKFCSDMCRNAHNNKVNSHTNNYVRNVNNALRRNRRILEACLLNESAAIPRQSLTDRGYNFTFITNEILSANQHKYYFCYEYGYQVLEDDLVLIVKKNTEG